MCGRPARLARCRTQVLPQDAVNSPRRRRSRQSMTLMEFFDLTARRRFRAAPPPCS